MPCPIDRLLRLRAGRAHEGCGPARHVLAAWVMGQMADAPVLWIRLRWNKDRLCPQGLRSFANPRDLILLDAAQDIDALACAEDGLRAGAVGLVVLDLAQPVALTPLRRLHLAAETGLQRRKGGGSRAGPIALILTPEQGGTPGVETRWQLAPCPAPARKLQPDPHWHLSRLRARMAPVAHWQVDGARNATPCAVPP